jgi:hypothetical protein
MKSKNLELAPKDGSGTWLQINDAMSKEEVILVHFSLAGMCFVTGE